MCCRPLMVTFFCPFSVTLHCRSHAPYGRHHHVFSSPRRNYFKILFFRHAIAFLLNPYCSFVSCFIPLADTFLTLMPIFSSCAIPMMMKSNAHPLKNAEPLHHGIIMDSRTTNTHSCKLQAK